MTQDGSLFQGNIYSDIVISAPKLALDKAWEAVKRPGPRTASGATPRGK